MAVKKKGCESAAGPVVTKGEFVALMALLAKKDRARYRELRALGWAGAIPLKSESPN